MLKKKIAVYANGWNFDSLQRILEGMRSYSAEHREFDIFVFLSHAAYNEHVDINEGELNIYNVAYMQDFDGVVILSNAMNSERMAKELCRNSVYLNVPAVSVGLDVDDVDYVGVDNDRGMQELVVHLIEKHNIQRVVYVGGAQNHPDSIARLKITRDVMKKYGMYLDPKDVYYTDWDYRKASRVAQAIVEDEEYPSAIICANDLTAMAVTTRLEEMGVRVPQDVIVTGFDALEEAENFYPAITTVRQNHEEVGYYCCQMLYERLEGRIEKSRKLASSQMVVGESCGCKGEIDYEEKRHAFCQRSYFDKVQRGLINETEQAIERSLSRSSGYKSLKRNLQSYFEGYHSLEGSTLYINLDGEYFNDVMADENELWEHGFRAEMEVVVALKDGVPVPKDTVNHHELIPGYRKEPGCKTYIFMPLHSGKFNFGVIIFEGKPPILQREIIYAYVEKLQQAFQNLRANLRLDGLNKNLAELYNKDSLTGLYNRFGYQNIAIPMYDSCVRNKEKMLIFFVDINYMKKINDLGGHIQGDNAIKLVADSIRQILKRNWIAIRFGGDEFLLVAPNVSEDEPREAKEFIVKYLEAIQQQQTFTYPVSVSCGYVVTDPNAGKSLQEYIKDADELMYQIKEEVHSKDKTK